MHRWLLAAAVAAACSRPGAQPVVHPSTEANQGSPCERVRAKVERLYRTEAEQREPTRVPEAVADNTQMVMNDCARDPRVGDCVDTASSVAQIERTCLIPLDAEGSEGEALGK
jgi:hypothetical protein